MNRLIEIAQELGDLYGNRAGLSIHKKHIELDLAARVVVITPVEGWPGKNAEQREVEAQRAFALDASILWMRDAQRDIEISMADIEATIEALEAERRALEWMIRGTLADALSGRRNGHGDIAEAAFDDALLGAADDTLFAQGPHPNGKPAFLAQPVHIGPDDLLNDSYDPAGYDEYKKSLTASATYEMLAPEPEEDLPF